MQIVQDCCINYQYIIINAINANENGVCEFAPYKRLSIIDHLYFLIGTQKKFIAFFTLSILIIGMFNIIV